MPKTENAIMKIMAYSTPDGGWAFDDEAVGLIREPFVAGMPEIITSIYKEAHGQDPLLPPTVNSTPEEYLVLTFSSHRFPGHSHAFSREHEEAGGWWYRHVESDNSGWLCPAMFKYFEEAPEFIYLNARRLRRASDAPLFLTNQEEEL